MFTFSQSINTPLLCLRCQTGQVSGQYIGLEKLLFPLKHLSADLPAARAAALAENRNSCCGGAGPSGRETGAAGLERWQPAVRGQPRPGRHVVWRAGTAAGGGTAAEA